MKKIISSLLVIVIVLSLCACDGGKIKLTKDNFDDYFTYSVYLEKIEEYEDYYVNYGSGAYSTNQTLGSKGQLSGSVTAVSQNYSYSDLTIRLKVTANCKMISKAEFDSGKTWFDAFEKPITYETEIKVDLNVAGEGEIVDTNYCVFPSNLLCASAGYAETIEILEVTGTVTPLR